MLQTIVIGHIGADAETKNVNGNEFTSFRVANTDRWTDDAGQTHEETTWVDCVMNGKPKVVEYLKKGVQVYVAGSARLRVYSSPKDRCMKAGVQVSVRTIELLTGKTDEVPSMLIDPETGTMHEVLKYYHCPDMKGKAKGGKIYGMMSKSMQPYTVDHDGWVSRVKQEVADTEAKDA